MIAVNFQGCIPGITLGYVETWTNIEYLPMEAYLNIV